MAKHSDLIGAEASHSTFIQRLGRGNANKVVSFLTEADEYISMRLAQEGETINSQHRLNVAQRDIRRRLNEIYGEWEVLRDADLLEIAPMEADFQVELLDKFTTDVDFTTPSDAQIYQAAVKQPLAIGRAGGDIGFEQMLNNWKPQQIKLTNSVISNGFVLGQTTGEISRRIRREVMPLSRRDSDSVVLTATNHMSNSAKIETYKDNDDVVIGYRLIAMLDGMTTAECRAWDQTVVLWSDSFKPAPPFHFRCRTQQVPELSEEFAVFEEGATRASKGADGGKQVSSDKQYYDWLKTQSASFQDDTLGRERGLIFRNAGLSPQEFKKASVDRFGSPLTIDQMAERNNKINEYLQ